MLADFAAYPEWNSVMRAVKGEAKAGTRLKVHVQPVNGLGLSFRPTVVRAEPGRELRWQGRFFHSSLFSGDHFFTIEPLGKNQVRFIHREIYTGLLAPLIMLILKSRNQHSFEEMNHALKTRAEKAPVAT